jgi:FkbM family methyltransferase
MITRVSRAGRARRKAAFYAKKLAWIGGMKSYFATDVGRLHVPRALVSSTIFYHLTNSDYEVPERTLLEENLSADDRVIELGAGIGFLAHVYGRRCPGQRHLAIEASPMMSDLIRTNTRRLDNVDVLNALAGRVSSTDGAATPPTVPFYVYEDFWASSTVPLHRTNPDRRLVQTVQVPVVDLDALIAERGCTMLVCDIEGGEAELLRTFALNVPKIVMELHWQTLGIPACMRVLTMLQERGYQLSGSPDVLMATKT